MHLIASDGADKSHDTTNTYNTTVTPIILECEKVVTKTQDDSNLWTTTTYTEESTCTGGSSTTHETYPSLFSICLIIILIGAVVWTIATRKVHKKRWEN